MLRLSNPADRYRTTLAVCDSVHEFCTATTEATCSHPNPYVAEDMTSRPHFYGGKYKTLADVIAMTTQAWTEGLEIVEGMIRELGTAELPAPKCRRRKLAWREDGGDELDYDRLRSGQDFWRSNPRQNTQGPTTVTIVADIAASAAYDADEVLWRGAAAVVLTYVLEQAGYRVELWSGRGSESCYRDGHSIVQAVCLKRSSDPLDLGSVVCGVSAWFLRVVMFHGTNLDHDHVPNSSQGTPMSVRPLMHEITNDPDAILVTEIWDRRTAMQKIRAIIEKFA